MVMTRATDNGVGPCVNGRAAIANAASANAAISIHADGGPVSGRGFDVVDPAQTLAPPAGGDPHPRRHVVNRACVHGVSCPPGWT